MTAAFDRPLTDQERDYLFDLAARCVADKFNSTQTDRPRCSTEDATDVLRRLSAEGKLEIAVDGEAAQVFTSGNLLLDAKRDWLAFHAQYPGLIRPEEFGGPPCPQSE
jgi:hypothetical protein